jgi:hypothetical protein
MVSSGSTSLALLLTSVAVASSLGPALHARRPDNEQELLANLERQQNPVKKSKYATRLAQLKLQQATDAYTKSDFEQGQKLLDDYLKWVRSSWDLLKGSGRPAERKPEGFKELDIALREDARRFADLEHRVPFTDRDPLTKAAQEAEKIRGEVLAALFPSGESRSLGKAGIPESKPAQPPPHFRSFFQQPLRAQQEAAALSEEEEDRLREEQDPGKRIELYLDFAQDRLTQFDQFRQKPADPKYDTGRYLDKLLGQYIALEDELKNWIQYQYDRQGDMRKGLRALLDRGPRQLEQLRHIQQEPDAFASDYRNSLRDAIDNLTDTLDGATSALSNQEKKFGEMKKQEKIDEQQAKQAVKEEKKRLKEEEKLRKKERKQKQVPEDVDQN